MKTAAFCDLFNFLHPQGKDPLQVPSRGLLIGHPLWFKFLGLGTQPLFQGEGECCLGRIATCGPGRKATLPTLWTPQARKAPATLPVGKVRGAGEPFLPATHGVTRGSDHTVTVCCHPLLSQTKLCRHLRSQVSSAYLFPYKTYLEAELLGHRVQKASGFTYDTCCQIALGVGFGDK